MKGNDNKILGVITARGGSRGIPRKNIKLLAGKPLIYYTIKAAQKSKLLDYFLVSTDDKEIADVAQRYGAEVPFLRPPELAQDKTKTLPVLLHALDWAEKNKDCRFDYILTLQPTSPLRTSQDIDRSIELAREHPNADSITSVYDLGFPPQKLKKIVRDGLHDYHEKEITGTRRQEYSTQVYKRNGAIYLTKRDTLLVENSILGSKIIPYIMPTERSVDIDTIFDFELAEFLKKKQASK